MDDSELLDELLENNESEKVELVDYYSQQIGCKEDVLLCRMGTTHQHRATDPAPNVDGKIVKDELFDLRLHLTPPEKTVSIFSMDFNGDKDKLNDDFLCLISQYVKDNSDERLPLSEVKNCRVTVILDKYKFNQKMNETSRNVKLFEDYVSFTETKDSKGRRKKVKKCNGNGCNPKHRGRHWDLKYDERCDVRDLIIIKRTLCEMVTVL